MAEDYAWLVDEELITADIMDPRWEESPFFKLKCMKAKQAGSRYEKIVENIFYNGDIDVVKKLVDVAASTGCMIAGIARG